MNYSPDQNFRTFRATLKQELIPLSNNTRNKIYLISFRYSNFFCHTKSRRVIGLPVRVLYKIIFNYILGFEVSDKTKVGFGFNVFHGQGIVIHEKTVIGNYFKIRHCTTIGNATANGRCPIIGDNVDVGAHSVIIGSIHVGDHSIIAAGSVVINDVPAYSLVAGNPAKVKKNLNINQ